MSKGLLRSGKPCCAAAIVFIGVIGVICGHPFSAGTAAGLVKVRLVVNENIAVYFKGDIFGIEKKVLLLKTLDHIPATFFLMMRRSLLILVTGLIISITSFAQDDITGTWEGKFFAANTTLGQPRLVVEIYNFKDSLFTGITHLYYEGNKYEHYKMIGWFSKKDSIIIFKEAATIAVDLGIYSNCLGLYTMVLTRKGNDLFQYGYWVPNIYRCTDTANTFLYKKIAEVKKSPPLVKKTAPTKPSADKPLKGKNTAPVIVPPTADPVVKKDPSIKTSPAVLSPKISQRETDVQSLLEIDAAEKDSIKVEVYDNGEIDGDSVSVYEEEVQRINKRMITAKPITFYVSLDKNAHPIVHLRLVAESLGSIPPCTALMIVTTRSKRYEVHLSSNFNKNATVELFLKE
jgi:hypothetical protein